MSDSGIFNALNRIEDAQGKLFDLVRETNERLSQRATESAVLHTTHANRIEVLEEGQEEMKIDKKGMRGAFLGAGLGGAVALAGAWIAKKLGIAAILIGFVVLAGCGTPQSLLATNSLNGDAARWIAATSPDPAIDDAATTIALGSDQIARKLGEPDQKPVYTPEAHKAAVAQAKTDLDQQEAVKKGITGWFQSAVTKFADIVWPGLGGILMGAFFWLRKKTQFDNLKAGTAPIVKVLEDHPDVTEKIMNYAGKIGVGAPVKAAVDMLKPKK